MRICGLDFLRFAICRPNLLIADLKLLQIRQYIIFLLTPQRKEPKSLRMEKNYASAFALQLIFINFFVRLAVAVVPVYILPCLFSSHCFCLSDKPAYIHPLFSEYLITVFFHSPGAGLVTLTWK